ncbi:MAG: DUF2797 domain-containing protein [Myxococcota bacterium]|nr:DUF2797 domain-containing protein [Myxococcota bacterium]
MPNALQGPVQKMKTEFSAGDPVRYTLPLGEVDAPLNDRIGKTFRLAFTGAISCIHCDRKIKKTFSQGYCYPCFQKLAQCDQCIVKPELCHFAQGTCREPEWGETHCMIPHTVYLANSSALKVGITRGSEPVYRWIDQGATQGLAIRRVASRLDSGHVEVALKPFVADKTNWRVMLKGVAEPLDLASERDALLAKHAEASAGETLGGEAIDDAQAVAIDYPVAEYPTKIVSHNFDKKEVLEGTLMGIKGQYLILDTAVVNIRKYGGYHLALDDAVAEACPLEPVQAV